MIDSAGMSSDGLETERPLMGGTQRLYRFSNGFGASVVRHRGSYGSREGLWELAVLDSSGSLTYATSITSDVEGRLDVPAVNALLARIKGLPESGQEDGVKAPEPPGLASLMDATGSMLEMLRGGDV